MVECWVSDDGAGNPEELIEMFFERLETDPEKKGGTGLGLAIVKEVVEAHRGQASVESKGATFRFSLPGQGSGEEAR